MLREVMCALNSSQKDEVMACIQSFPLSGLRQKLTGNVCRYVFYAHNIKYAFVDILVPSWGGILRLLHSWLFL